MAFSAVYIFNRPEEVRLYNAIFQITSLAAGKEYHFEVQHRFKSFEVCSVARGKLEIFLGKLVFVISEGGMWRVKASETCVVKYAGKEKADFHAT
jgi:hypothetical protein